MNFIVWLALTVLQILLAPKPPEPKRATLDDFSLPTAEPGRSIPVVFGTVTITGPNVVWYGHLRSTPIKKKSLFTSQVVGHRYYLGMHLALAHPIDALTRIEVGDKLAWSGSAATGQISINAPSLFGGDDSEGGISGEVDVLDGGSAQQVNDYLAARLGAPLPAFRGVFTLVARQIYIGNSAYLKKMAFRVKRTAALADAQRSPQWYQSKADIAGDLNPAHILREVLTSSEWGMAYPVTIIDDASFAAAADTLYAEGLGMSLQWVQSEQIEQFVQGVLDTIAGILTQDPATGLMQLLLVRDDYDAPSLPLFDESNTLDLTEFERRAWGETINEVTVMYRDRETNKDTPVTVQDLGNIQIQGTVINETKRYAGISTAANALRVTQRDLRVLSAPLSRLKITVNRQGWSLTRGGVFRFSWVDLGLMEVVYRIIDINYGSAVQGRITIDAVEDVFALPSNSIVAGHPSQWVAPDSAPAPLSFQAAFEASYLEVQQGLEAADLAALPADFGLLLAAGARNADDAYDVSLLSRADADPYQSVAESGFTPTATLTGLLDGGSGGLTGVVIPLADGIDLDLVGTGSLARLGSELVLITSIDVAAPSVTVSRGMLDTVPQAHAAGTRVWFTGSDLVGDTSPWVAGQSVDAKLLPRTSQGRLEVASAAPMTVVMAQRYQRPYAPGNLRLNGVAYPATISGELVVSWSHRDRIAQGDALTNQTAGNQGPEVGTTYTLRLYNELGALVRTEAGLTGTAYTWTTETADSGLGRLNNALRVELESVRDGLTSWQAHDVSVSRV